MFLTLILFAYRHVPVVFWLLGFNHSHNGHVTGHIHIVNYLIKTRDLVTRQERIDALELLGTTYVDKKKDMIGGLECWKRAMEER